MYKKLFVVACFMGLVGCGSGTESSAPAEGATVENTPAEPPIETTADALLKAYKDNEISANNQFKGKNILVSASIESIQADFSDKPFLTLKAGDQFEFNQPQAHFAESDEAKAGDLKKGQKVTLLCVGDSEMAGTPMLKDCVLQ
jgi:hypothetical protein